MTTLIAATAWSDAAVAVAGIVLVTVVLAVAIAQVFKTGRAGIEGSANADYKQLAERSNELLETMSTDLADVRARLGEVERLLKDVG